MTDPADAARTASILAVGQRYSALTPEGRDWYGSCPAGCAREDGFVITPSFRRHDGRLGQFLCRPSGATGDVIDLVQHAEGVGFNEAVEIIISGDFAISPAAAQVGDSEAQRQERNARLAVDALERARLIETSPVAIAYFALRAIDILSFPHGAGLRSLPDCPWEIEGVGRCSRACVIARFSDAVTGAPMRSIWRRNITPIALDSAGRGCRWSKPKALGARAGGVIRLWPDCPPGPSLCAGEGIESTLSAIVLGEASAPAWACGGAGSMGKLPVIDGVKSLRLIVDHDANGVSQRAAEECAERWLAAGREVSWRMPPDPGTDFNDVLRRRTR
jgi:hypothetical protein